MKNATSLTPTSNGLSGFQLILLKVMESLIQKDKKNCHNAEMKPRERFTDAAHSEKKLRQKNLCHQQQYNISHKSK